MKAYFISSRFPHSLSGSSFLIGYLPLLFHAYGDGMGCLVMVHCFPLLGVAFSRCSSQSFPIQSASAFEIGIFMEVRG
jgi:hypothetical protein